MLERGYLVLLLVMASLLATAMVHAQEFSGVSMLECSGFVHTQGDADQSPGDADKAVPHHHSNCQSAPAFLPVFRDDRTLDRSTIMASASYASALTHRWSIGPGLRPPIV